MAKLYNTLDEYVGVPPRVSGPQAVMHPYNFQNIAGNQSLVFERLCNLDCDGTGSPALNNEGHDHTEDHNQPHLPLLFRSYGNENVPVLPATITQPLTVENDDETTSDVILIYCPFFVPAGLVDRSLLLVMHMEGDGSVAAEFETWAGGPPKTPTTVGATYRYFQPASQHPALKDSPTARSLWWLRFYPEAAGLHTLKITTGLFDIGTDTGREYRRQIRAITLINEPNWAAIWGVPNVAKPDLPAANLVDVGDSRNANGWTCPTTHLYPYEGNGPGSLSPGVRFLALNDAWLQEKALGLPAAGQATMTVSAGHKHTGASGDGAEIQIPVLALPVGRPAAENRIYGEGSGGPSTTSNSYSQVLQFEIYTPDHTYALDEGVNPRLRCAVLMHGEHSKTGGVVTRVSTTESGTPSTTAVEFATDASLAAPHYELVTSTSGFTFTPAGRTLVTVELKVVSGAATGPGTLMGLCFWISPT